jgi:membrane protein
MSWLRRIPGIASVSRFVGERAQAVWSRDRSQLGFFRALGNRLFRIAILVGRGFVVHRITMLAASLTFFTVFSIVPMLVVVLWTLKLTDHLPMARFDLSAQQSLASGNQLLHAALAEIFGAVERAGEVTGLVGLAALLYVASKMFSVTERALFTISGSGRQTPRPARAFGYLALLLMPPVVVGVVGLLQTAVRQSSGQRLYRLIGWIPGLDIFLLVAVGFGFLWLASTLLYWAAVRARIPFVSACVGGFVSALALPIVFWAYVSLQLGVSQASTLGSGFLAFPVFLMWSFSSWCALLIGAEIAVAHHVDAVLIHGARAFALDLAGEREASMAILIRLARRPGAVGPPELSEDELARTLRLPPQLVRNLCVRLVDRHLLVEAKQAFSLAFDPAQTTVAELVDAVERDPALAVAHREVEDEIPTGARKILAAPRRALPPKLTLAQLAASI